MGLKMPNNLEGYGGEGVPQSQADGGTSKHH